VIVLSNHDRNLYIQKFGIYPRVIYNPLTILPDGKAQGNKKFLAIGRFSPLHKGFDILIKAFALFAEHDSEWTLDIVGDGPEKKYFESLIEEYALHDRISIYPFTKDIGTFYKNASVYILSSRWEGQALVILEALSFGLPLITSAIPITEEILDNKGVALFFENENPEDLCRKMVEMANLEEDKLTGMSDNALLFVKNFSISEIIPRWEELLHDLE
jgi:glycosyltransferase involved in cell wall biosynthesis